MVKNSKKALRRVAFEHAAIICPDKIIPSGWLISEGGRIVGFGTGRLAKGIYDERFDLEGDYLAPGFVDIHVHGGGGADFMDGTVDAVRQVCQTHARHGTTTIIPTTTTGPQEQILAMIHACREVQYSRSVHQGSRIDGVHLYGPYFAPGKSGCHSDKECRPPHKKEFQQYFATGMIRVATCAAELPHAAEFYRVAAENKCLVTCGHSNASWSEMDAAFELGMRHVDHFWCAMSNVSSVRTRLGVPMQGSMLEYVLAKTEMSTEVIADGCHLAPELLKFAYQMKSPKRLCLVTDSNRALDMPPGRYRFGHRSTGTWLTSDGQVGWANPTSLASSVRGMDHMVRIMYRDSDAPLHDVIRMASLTPAERCGLSRSVGSIDLKKKSDLLILSPDLQVKKTFVNGECIHSA
jgi:N-acetylglucosamine-6-phosphate deacetylase